MVEDEKIEKHNKRLRAASNTLLRHQEVVSTRTNTLTTLDAAANDLQRSQYVDALEKAKTSLNKSQATYNKIVESGGALLQSGSGKVPVLMPVRAIERREA